MAAHEEDPGRVSRHLAQNIQALRQLRSLSQSALSKLAGVPRSTVTHLESGEGNPSLQNLLRLARALEVSVEELLAEPRAHCTLVRGAEVPVQERASGAARIFKLLPRPVPGLEIDRMELAPGALMRGVPHLAGTREFLACERGQVVVYVAGENFNLEPGDVLAFPGDQVHSYRNPGRDVSICFSIVALTPTPPRRA